MSTHRKLAPAALAAALAGWACKPAQEAPAPALAPPPALAATLATVSAAEARYDPSSHSYAGSDRCMPCHVAAFTDWKASSHATTVLPAEPSDEEVVSAFIECSDLPFTHVLGDRHHVRYLVHDEEIPWGKGRVLALPCGWDMHESEVTLHHPEGWRELPWESGCAACHVTGFRAADHGFLEYGIGCEECHGPAEEHAGAPTRANVLSFQGMTAREEVTVCASCHLQGGRSVSTGLKLPPAYLAGGPLFDDYHFDWSELEQDEDGKVLDLHQKFNVRNVVVNGDDSLRCTSCHSLHALGHEKHAQLPKQDYCFLCHQADLSLKEYSQSCNVCEF